MADATPYSAAMTQSPTTVLALGDSLVAGYGLAREDGLPVRLRQRLRERHPDTDVVDGGVSGDTSADVLRRLPRLLSGMSRRPDLALVQVGPNDLLRGVAPAAVRGNLSAIVHALTTCGVPVLLTRVEPPALLRVRAAPYRAIHDTVAREHGAALCSFFPDNVLGHPDMVLADRIHPNARAIAAVVEHLLLHVERMLADARAGVG